MPPLRIGHETGSHTRIDADGQPLHLRHDQTGSGKHRDEHRLDLPDSLGRAAVFNVYGPRQSLSNPYTGVMAIFISRLANGNPPVVYEDGLQTRDFISIHERAVPRSDAPARAAASKSDASA